MTIGRALLEAVACMLAGFLLGIFLIAFLRTSEAASNWIGELVYLIRYGI